MGRKRKNSNVNGLIKSSLRINRILEKKGVIINHSTGTVTKNGVPYNYWHGSSKIQPPKNWNDPTKGILTLPEEIISIILDHVNQIDIVHFALTHRSFREICKRKLMENIHVDSSFLVPKNFYIPVCINYTFVNLNSFKKLIRGNDSNLRYIKNIFFEELNSKIFLIMKSERIKQLKCSINFGELNISDYDYESVPWLSEYQLETKPTKLILSDGMNLELRNYPLDTIKELNLYCLESTKTQTRLSFIELMPNLEKLILINPPNFQLPEPVDILDLQFNYDFDRRADIFCNFNINKIKKLRIVYEFSESFDMHAMLDVVEKFTSLESLNVNFDELGLVSFVENLKENTLKEIGVPESLDSFKTIYPALLHHRESIKVIFENQDYFHANFVEWKIATEPNFDVDLDLDLNLDEFPKLEYVVRNGNIIFVDRNEPYPEFVSVEYHHPRKGYFESHPGWEFF